MVQFIAQVNLPASSSCFGIYRQQNGLKNKLFYMQNFAILRRDLYIFRKNITAK
jgi:hypothetical protein